MRKKLLFFAFIIFHFGLMAQPQTATWKITQKDAGDGMVELIFTATVASQWYIYSVQEMDGPMPTTVVVEKTADFELMGALEEGVPAGEKFDEAFEIDVRYYSGTAVFVQKIKRLTEKEFMITGAIEYQSCSDSECIPNEYKFTVKVEQGVAGAATSEKTESFWWFILMAIGFGLAAILTPCVFPMIPMTVSFFMQGSGNRMQTVIKALIFCLSVGFIYGLIGVIVAIFKNPAIATVISTSWYMNLIFALMFIVFAMSFFGMFEITLPTGLANKADRQADKGGYLASFFMAAALAIVSFSCTGPFVGSLLPEAATGVSKIKPILGLTCFGLAMASPFLLVAIFPSLMKKLKSGSWLNSVKVVFAFIMLGFCVKFLNQVDVDAELNILTREVAIGFWIVLAVLMGCYVLGKIKFAHDSDVKYVSVPRLFIVIVSFTFVAYLLPGLFGADLDAVAAFLPAKDKQQFDLKVLTSSATSSVTGITKETPCGDTPKYADTKMHTPAGIKGYFDLQEAMACAKSLNRPILLDFTGHGCSNCKKMEAAAFKDTQIIELMNTEFVWVSLYYDEKTELPMEEQSKEIKTIGKKNHAYQTSVFKTVASPYFAIITADGEILVKGLGLAGAEEFLQFANEGLNQFKTK